MQISWDPDPIRAGSPARLRILLDDEDPTGSYTFAFDTGEPAFGGATTVSHRMRRGLDFEPEVSFDDEGQRVLRTTPPSAGEPNDDLDVVVDVAPAPAPAIPTATVALVAGDPPPSADQILWTFIDEVTDRLRFDEFHEFVRPRMTGEDGPLWFGTDAYDQLRRLADDFVATAVDPVATAGGELSRRTATAGVARSYVSSQRAGLPRAFPSFAGPRVRAGAAGAAPVSERAALLQGVFAQGRFPLPNVPFVELIWNYWIEEGALVQTMNHILARFQNRRAASGPNPLGRFDLNPLMPLRSLLWGFAEAENQRLTVRRRAGEYEVQYGLRLVGRAVPPESMLVDRRTAFLEAFHTLLNSAQAYYKERDDKTVDADAFPLLNGLREVHLVLAQGAHNQFADLPVTARAEMITMQWTLALPEFREFLGGPTMVPYEEPWMDRVETMKTLQGWSDASITHFFELARCGEKLLLSMRHGRWNESSRTRDDAANWALRWRNDVQRYMHAYRAVTGVDLTSGVDATMPSTLLMRRLRDLRRQA